MGSLIRKFSWRHNLFIGVAAILAAPCHAAQQLPVPAQASVGASFLIREKLSSPERDFFWKKTGVAADGYLRIAGSKEEVDIVAEVRKLPFITPTADGGLQTVILAVVGQGFPFVGAWKEDQYRTTLLFGNEITGSLMYTRFEYAKANVSVTVAKDFVRFSIKKSPAVLTLTVSGENKALWKLTTWREGTAHELYLTDDLEADGRPRRNFRQIIRLAESIIDCQK